MHLQALAPCSFPYLRQKAQKTVCWLEVPSGDTSVSTSSGFGTLDLPYLSLALNGAKFVSWFAEVSS